MPWVNSVSLHQVTVCNIFWLRNVLYLTPSGRTHTLCNAYFIQDDNFNNSNTGTPTKRQVSKRQDSKRLVSKRLKCQVYKTLGLQNVRFTKCQVYKTSGLQNIRLQKKHPCMFCTCGCWKTRRFCCSHVCRQSDGCVLFSILEGCFAIYHHNG